MGFNWNYLDPAYDANKLVNFVSGQKLDKAVNSAGASNPLTNTMGLGSGGGNLPFNLGSSNTPQGTTTSTSTQVPWEAQQPYLQALFAQASKLSQQPASSLVPQYSPFTQQAINTMGQGIPGYSNLTNLTNQTLQGDYLNSNPYLDQAYQQGANQLKSNISSMFGPSRFGSGAMANATASGLADLSNQVYGGNYQAERNRQQQMAALAPSILSAPVNNQLQAGQMVDQRNQALAQAPWNQLGLYQGGISGNYGGTTTMTQPYYQNKGAGILGGAMSGAGLANMMGMSNPWLFALGGGLLGAQ